MGLVNIMGLKMATPKNAAFCSQMLSSFFGHLNPRFRILSLLEIKALLEAHSEKAGIGQVKHHILPPSGIRKIMRAENHRIHIRTMAAFLLPTGVP
jgi:hypothetical protein